jgi:FATC domain
VQIETHSLVCCIHLSMIPLWNGAKPKYFLLIPSPMFSFPRFLLTLSPLSPLSPLVSCLPHLLHLTSLLPHLTPCSSLSPPPITLLIFSHQPPSGEYANDDAVAIIKKIEKRLMGHPDELGLPLSVEGQVYQQIQEATSAKNLSQVLFYTLGEWE